MKIHAAILISLLSSAALATADGRHAALPHKRQALPTVNRLQYADARFHSNSVPNLSAYVRADAAILARAAKAEAVALAWAPKVEGKYIKDTLKCNNKHVCSGEIVVAN